MKESFSGNPLRLTSLNHISLLCRSVERSMNFYRNVLGFLPIRRPVSFKFEGAWLFGFGVGIHLLQAEDPEKMPCIKKEINPKDNHISFQCEAMGEVEKRLEEMGVDYVRAAVVEGVTRVEQLFFHDPDGFMIEICNCDCLPVVPLAGEIARSCSRANNLQKIKMGKDLKRLVSRCIYVGKVEENVKKLKNATDELKDLRSNVMKRIKVCEEQQRLKRLEKVQVWLRESETVVKEAEDLVSKRGPTHMAALKLDKKVAKKLKEVQEIKSKGTFEVIAVASDHHQTVDLDDQMVGLEPVAGLIWRCLTVDNTGVIGLYGIGGVGKTTVMMQVNNKLLQHKANGCFDFVIWVFVSKNVNLEKIQDTIREKIGFLDKTWTSKSEEEKAATIFEILSNRKFALFLDDVWEKIDLVKIGVPIPNAQNKSKVVFTTCSDEVCREMGAQTKIKVERLPWDKSWDLFKKNVGEETLKSHPEIAKVAEEVAGKCDGLPLALVTIGRAMASKKTPQEWRDALYILSSSSPNFSVLKLLDKN